MKKSVMIGLAAAIALPILAPSTRQLGRTRHRCSTYKVNTDAISARVKQKFAAKEMVSAVKEDAAKKPTKAGKKAKAE